MNPLESLLDRRSYSLSKLGHPAPSEEELRNLFDLVMTTPDHGNVKPWRFIVARGENMQKLGDLTLELYKRQSPDGEVKDKAYRSAREVAAVPMMIMVVTDLDPEHKVSLWDQRLCVGAAAQNIMNGLHLMGYGGLWYTFLANNDVKPMFGMKPDDQVVGAIAVGTPTPHFVKKIKRQSPDRYCFEWQGLGQTPTPLFGK
ncbi:nitroreductase family protein [Moritella sp. PE36]|uniref:nitroreductase family protein n=1 Tax=Moritella sp. PE36 TaxID=58051 RepID=UPI00015688CA|nr:nitroreductase [Moritella sp. PE36]EDM67939.1 nitroreductase family protein [Moritella sp. PE36]